MNLENIKSRMKKTKKYLNYVQVSTCDELMQSG